MSRTRELAFSGLITVLAGVAALAGLASSDLYRDPAVLLPQLRGQDLVTLAVGVPLLLAGMAGLARDSLRGRLVWLGALGYLVYGYATYVFGAVWNPFYLAYVAILGLSLYTFVLGLLATPVESAATALRARMPRRTVAWFLLAVAAAFALLWLADEVTALARGEVPRSIVEMGVPTNFIHGIDLAIVLPGLAITGWLLREERSWGFVLSAVLLVKAFTLGAAVLAMAWFSARAGLATDPVLSGVFVVVTLFAGGLIARTLLPVARQTDRAAA